MLALLGEPGFVGLTGAGNVLVRAPLGQRTGRQGHCRGVDGNLTIGVEDSNLVGEADEGLGEAVCEAVEFFLGRSDSVDLGLEVACGLEVVGLFQGLPLLLHADLEELPVVEVEVASIGCVWVVDRHRTCPGTHLGNCTLAHPSSSYRS